MKHNRSYWAGLLLLTLLAACSANPADKSLPKKIPVIFDTDVGNDIDDVLAMAMLYHYADSGLIDLQGITISKGNPDAARYADALNHYYGHPGIPIGYVGDGPNPEPGKYLRPTLDTLIDGKKVLPGGLLQVDSLLPAWRLHRKLLAAAADSSVVMIVVGPETNIRLLLQSGPDEYSPLSGVELVGKKVRLLSVMGGRFDAHPSGENLENTEWNIVQDTVSARVLFDEWPGAVVASGYEIGNAVLYPASSILKDFEPAGRHPLAVSYKLFDKMPYDRPCWDLTAVLQAIEPEAQYFDLSAPGTIRVAEGGGTVFTPSANGRHRYLLLNDRRDALVQALVRQVTKGRGR